MFISRLAKTTAFLLALCTAVSTSHADTWQGRLKGGGVVNVDPYTHKPILQYQGRRTQLWNGVHEMDDGSVVIVRDGVAVPDERMLNTWSGRTQEEASDRPLHCEELVRKVCGFANECSESAPCATARQLRTLEQDELRQAPYGQKSASAGECDAGLADEALFPACQAAMGPGNTPCGKLVKRVCGDQRQCVDSEDCRLAGQLLDMENEERMSARDSNARTDTEQQCRQVTRTGLFKACVK